MNNKKKIQKRSKYTAWLLIYLIMTVLAAPNAAISKYILGYIDPLTLPFLRYTLVSLILLPLFIIGLRKYAKVIRKNLKVILFFSVIASSGAFLYNYVINNTSASWIVIADMLSPIVFAIISCAVFRSKITRQSFMGLMLAVLGGVVVMVFPLLMNNPNWQGVTVPVIFAALIFIVIQGVLMVFMRYENEKKKVPIPALLYINFTIAAIFYSAIIIFRNDIQVWQSIVAMPLGVWIAILYMAIFVSIIVRALRTKGYEAIGTAPTATIDYIYYPVALVIPIIVFHEHLSWEMILGSILIIVGILLSKKHSHHHLHHSVK